MHTRPVLALLAAVVAASTGCDRFRSASAPDTSGSPPWLTEKPLRKKSDTAEADAIVRVLEADRERFKAGFATLGKTAQPSQAVKMINDYVDHLDKADTAGVPKDVVAARAKHAKAWRKLSTSLKKQPDAYDDTEFMDAMAALFRGDEDKGKKLGGDVVEATEKVTSSYLDIYDAAQKNGVEIQK